MYAFHLFLEKSTGPVFFPIEFRRNPCLGLYLQEPKARVRLSFVVKKDLCYIRIFTGTREEEEGE